MKKTTVIAALLCAASTALFAQTLNVTAPGFTGTKLFDSSPGFVITAMGADSSGNVYYIETHGSFASSTKLYKRTAAGGYVTATPLFDYGTALFGSFVTVHSGKVYFGENSANTIRSVNLDGSSPALIGTVVGNYDLAFSGSSAFVSANPDTTFVNPQGRVLTLNLGTGATQMVLDATPDYSGPIVFDALGNLIYGVANSVIGGIYQYSAGQVANAISTSTPLVLTPPTGRFVPNGANLYLAYEDGTTVWQDDFNTLRKYDLSTGTGSTIATTTDVLGFLDYTNGKLFTSVTNFSTNSSAVFNVVPEPSSTLMLAFGSLILLRRRK